MSAYQIFVPGYFVSGLIFSSIVLAALLGHRLLTPPPAGPAGDSFPAPKRLGAAGWTSIAFAAVLLERVLVVDSIMEPTFVYQDESADSCIDPLRQKLGMPSWGASTSIYSIRLPGSFSRPWDSNRPPCGSSRPSTSPWPSVSSSSSCEGRSQPR